MSTKYRVRTIEIREDRITEENLNTWFRTMTNYTGNWFFKFNDDIITVMPSQIYDLIRDGDRKLYV